VVSTHHRGNWENILKADGTTVPFMTTVCWELSEVMGIPLKSSILDWDVPLESIQLLGYPHFRKPLGD